MPRSAIIWTRSRKLSLNVMYHLTHRMIISWSKCRPLNRSCAEVGSVIPAVIAGYPAFQQLAPEPFVDMTDYKNNSFSRRLPDVVTEELVIVLSEKTSYEFKQLFEVVHDNLRQRHAAHGGQELLRLRAYEKLHNLVSRGAVKKNGKIYTGNSAALGAMAANVHHGLNHV